MSDAEFIANAYTRVKRKLEVKEIDIEDEYCNYARNKGVLALKLQQLGKKGFPDRTNLVPDSTIFFIEFKKKDKPLRPTQVKRKRLLEKKGFRVFVCDEKGQAEKILDLWLKGIR